MNTPTEKLSSVMSQTSLTGFPSSFLATVFKVMACYSAGNALKYIGDGCTEKFQSYKSQKFLRNILNNSE
jgi:hypothetical protein